MSLELTIVTPEGETFAGEVEQVVLPGAEGDFGVLEGHERFLAPLKHGAVEIIEVAGHHWAAVSDGIADVSAERVVVLADYCALADDIDVAMAEEERAEIEAQLEVLTGDHDAEGHRADLEDAMVRIQVWIDVAGRGST